MWNRNPKKSVKNVTGSNQKWLNQSPNVGIIEPNLRWYWNKWKSHVRDTETLAEKLDKTKQWYYILDNSHFLV